MHELQTLDLRFNVLIYVEDVKILTKQLPALLSLDLRNNNFEVCAIPTPVFSKP